MALKPFISLYFFGAFWFAATSEPTADAASAQKTKKVTN